MNPDPLTHILQAAGAQPMLTGMLHSSGSWCLRFPPPDKIKFMAITRGHCYLLRDGEATPYHLEAGDVVFHSEPRGFLMYTDPDAPEMDVREVYPEGPVAVLGEGRELSIVGGHVKVGATSGRYLEELLPRWLHLKGATPAAEIVRWLLERLVAEAEQALPGAGLASTQLVQLLFVQVLRCHLAESGDAAAPGRFRALGDPRLRPALELMHGNPGHPWQLEELARAAGMSRTSFAVYFREVAGIPPLTYLAEWRMQSARQRLLEEDVPVATLAEALGYASESAFSNAFKRHTGLAPKRYRQGALATAG